MFSEFGLFDFLQLVIDATFYADADLSRVIR